MVRAAPHLDRLTRRTARGTASRGRTRPDHTPYGVAMHGPAADVNGDGVVTVSDLGVVSANHNSGDELKPGDTGYDPDAFLDGGDEIDVSVFLTRYSPYVSGGSNPTFNAGWIDNPNDPNGPDNSVGYDGYWFDLAGATESTSTGLYMVRFRVYDPKLGRWLQRDPMGYLGGRSLYLYSHASPVSFRDQTGLLPSPTSLIPVPEDFTKRCGPWRDSDKRTKWSFEQCQFATRNNITLPAHKIVDLTLTILDVLGIGSTSVRTWKDCSELKRFSFIHEAEIKMFQRRNALADAPSLAGMYLCRCRWEGSKPEERDCSWCGFDFTETQWVRVNETTLGVLAYSRNNVLFCHCPNPDKKDQWTIPKAPEDIPPVMPGE